MSHQDNNKNMDQVSTTSGALRTLRSAGLAALGGSLLLAGCGGGSAGGSGSGAGSSHNLLYVGNGFAELLPHKTYVLDSLTSPGGPVVMAIRSQQDLIENVNSANPVQPVPSFPQQAILPSGQPGNQFLIAQFSNILSVGSVLSSNPALVQSNSFTGSLIVSAVDPTTGSASVIKGQAFINGFTYGSTPTGSPAALPYEQWVGANGEALAVDTDHDGIPDAFPGFGFPGTQGAFNGSASLISPTALVFVVDSDNDLTTHEMFPAGVQIVMEVKTSVLDESARPLGDAAYASTTLGPDDVSPEVRLTPPPTANPVMVPAFNSSDVDPLTNLIVEFTEPVQPEDVGSLLSTTIPNLSASIGLSFGPTTARVDVPFSVRPLSVYDLTRWELTPVFNFPGSGPNMFECGIFSRVDIEFRAGNVADLAGNSSTLPATSFFTTGEGPGIVNLPVTPDTIYIGRAGGAPGISVIDLFGFGAGTGNPTFDPGMPVIQGNSNYPNNPNLRIQAGAMIPPLQAGTCTVDGGSAGVFTLALDSSLEDKVVRAPVLLTIGEMMLGVSLDATFNNGPAPFGCQGGGGNLCAADGFKQIITNLAGSSVVPGQVNGGGQQLVIDGGPNIVGWAPHPNPPPLIYPPLCVSPFIGGQEPTSVDTAAPNLLTSGSNPLGNPATQTPPDTLLARQPNLFFQGPSLPPTPPVNLAACTNYGLRQALGQFIYVIDRARNEIVVLNSNRMTVIDRILVSDPTTLAFATNLDLLAVTSQSSNSVVFIDVDPASQTFHEVTKTVTVGTAPRGIVWEPGNEDILVCNEGSNSVSIISAFSLEVRKVVTSGLIKPFDLCITPRQVGFGLNRNVYFAYILGRNGKVTVFESGPNGVNGWGFDDMIGNIPMEFLNPKAIHPDPVDLRSAFWIIHEGRLDQASNQLAGPATEGAITGIVAESGTTGQIILSNFLIPQIRDINYVIKVSMGEDRLSGVPVDLTFDDQVNAAALPNFFTLFSAGAAVILNGKSIVRLGTGGGLATSQPSYMFVAVPTPSLGVGGIDVIGLSSGAFLPFDTNPYEQGIQGIDAPGAVSLMDYFKQ